MAGTHDGHRSRMMKKVRENGFEGLEEHEILEVLLFYAIPRKDTNELAHRLIKKFGSLNAVCEAPMVSLCEVDGVGEAAATFIRLIPEISRAYHLSKVRNIKVIGSCADAGEFLSPYFIGLEKERFYMVSMDSAGKVLGVDLINEGTLNYAVVDVRKIVEISLQYKATKVIVAHNHPRSIALASKEDLQCTKRIREILASIGVKLEDHLIFSYGLGSDSPLSEYISMAEDGIL
ncbi:MAG: RadC family protein [Clostridia bacterium]|nr:RadC family protein [Clostridia bacterium]